MYGKAGFAANLENAINYGVSGMDDCGEIKVTGRLREGSIVLSVEDNGIGMSEEEVRFLLTDSSRVRKHGSGVGLVNVNNRVQILFGKEFGLRVESEPDEGTLSPSFFPQCRIRRKTGRFWRWDIYSTGRK